jgi:nucleotide-binding universal stress UspA family protein
MIGTVVIGVDASKHSARLVDWCCSCFADTPTRLVVVACYTRRPELGGETNDLLRDELAADVAEVAQPLAAAGIDHEQRVLDGDPRLVLQQVALESGADLLAVASRGHGQVTDLLLGSVASYLTHHSRTPIVVVR